MYIQYPQNLSSCIYLSEEILTNMNFYLSIQSTVPQKFFFVWIIFCQNFWHQQYFAGEQNGRWGNLDSIMWKSAGDFSGPFMPFLKF